MEFKLKMHLSAEHIYFLLQVPFSSKYSKEKKFIANLGIFQIKDTLTGYSESPFCKSVIEPERLTLLNTQNAVR